MTNEQLAEAIKMATWFTNGHDDHLRSPAWNIANALLHEHKRAETAEADLRTKETQLAQADAVIAWCDQAAKTEFPIVPFKNFDEWNDEAVARHQSRQGKQ